ncbi:MAG TPA: CARDB domain-containing protein, partial [Candidatus Acidoferrum sp.]|nr:CARDB domain-containing protein [Candidatus Acidoferrum sp.]
LNVPANLIIEGADSIFATVTRNGDRSAPLIVTVTNSSPADLEMTNTVIIPADAASASFALTPIHDHIVDGNRFVVFGVTNADYQGASFGLTVVDIDVPMLTLSFGEPSVAEGMTVPCTVTRDYATNRELVVVLNPGDSTQLTPPTFVTIPSNQLSYSFAVLATDNNVVEPTRTNSLIASAAGFQSATANIITFDNDLPTVTLRLAAHSVSEGAGSQATVATVTRAPVSPRGLRLALTSSDDGIAQLQDSVVIPGGQESASFPVSAIDNQIVDGNRSVTFRVFILDVSGDAIAEGSGDTLQLLDDDGPTLKLAIDRDAVPEGQSPIATATITRNTATNAALTILISSSATGELTTPVSVVMPAGASTVTAPLSSVLDGISDGNKSVTVTASSGGFTPGSAVIVVTDIDLPDLVVRNVTTPTNGITDANFAITYRIENRGIASCFSNFVTRIFLSTDAIPSGDDRVLSEFPFEGTLAVSQFIEQTAQYALPGKSGRYWIIIVTDAANQIPEVLENNNTFVAALPIVVSPAYTATVQTEITTSPTGTPIVMNGTATRVGGGVMPNAPVNVHIEVRGTRRIVPVQTDATGHFMLTWAPLSNEAGNYEIGAAHPGEEISPVQDAFTLIGVKLAPPVSEITVTEGLSITGQLAAANLGETTLSGLTAQVVSAPANLSVTATLAASSLAGDEATDLAVVITANNAAIPFGEVRVRVTAPGGVSAEAIYGVRVSALHPHLVAMPDSLYSIMIGGQQTSVEFDVVNDGGIATGPLTISVPVAPWLTVSSVNPMPAMQPGTTNRVTLLLTPSVDLPLGPYRNSAVISDGFSAGVSVPFEFLNVSEGKGHLRVSVLDEYTYYAVGGPKVTNATVTVRDAISQAVVTNGVTDASGEIVFTNLTEAYYQFDVSAEKHSTFSGTILVRGGRTNDFDAFLSRETVQYHWSVVPATIEDRTRITLTTEFETFVPVPVVTIDPPLIDMKDFGGSVTQINLVIRNHGLVAAQDFVFDLPQDPDFEFTSLVNELGPIPAMTTVSVPLTIRRIGGGLAAAGVAKAASASASSGPCSVSVGG